MVDVKVSGHKFSHNDFKHTQKSSAIMHKAYFFLIELSMQLISNNAFVEILEYVSLFSMPKLH